MTATAALREKATGFKAAAPVEASVAAGCPAAPNDTEE
jgi:hypothetical protein